jgi:hypothetical protein
VRPALYIGISGEIHDFKMLRLWKHI